MKLFSLIFHSLSYYYQQPGRSQFSLFPEIHMISEFIENRPVSVKIECHRRITLEFNQKPDLFHQERHMGDLNGFVFFEPGLTLFFRNRSTATGDFGIK